MKKVYLLLVLNSLSINIWAQYFDWAKREGLWAYDYGYGVTTDNAGNIYVAGKYEEVNANFSDTLIPCEGNHDIYLAQYSPSGNLNWIRTAGGVLGDYATAVSCDGSNYVYIAGEIEGVNSNIIFQGSTTTLTSVCFNDIFLAKYDLSGNLIWAKQAGWWHNEKALGITQDQAGNVYICGFFNDTTMFESTQILGYGKNDIFIAKYNSLGDFLWVKKAGSSERDEAKFIKCDPAGNVYICGMYSDGCSFGTQTLASPNGYFNTFLAKYAPDGTLKWVKTSGGNYDDVAWGLTMDNAGKIYIGGEFNDALIFAGSQLSTTGSSDVFVACYDSLGTELWAKKAGGNYEDRARGIGSDGTKIYITGQFSTSASFGTHVVTGSDTSEIFISALNNTGTFLWATSVGGVADSVETLGYESGNTICADASGNVYASGALLDGGVFGSTSVDEWGRTDVFITKITQGPDVIAPLAVTLSPADNSLNVPSNSNLVITFNENIQKGTGNILIKESGVITQTIAVSGTNVTVLNNVVTVNPADFTSGASVNVEIAAGVFKDMANNNYAGITTTTGWNFSVEPAAVSMAEISGTSKIVIYPNPVNGILNIDLSRVVDQKMEILIFNCLGGIIERRINVSPSKINIDLSAIKNGIYFITINGEHTEFNQKIIIQE